MSGLFSKPKAQAAVYAPSPDDERQRQAALREQQKKGGRGTTVLTSGLAAPADPGPDVTAPKTVLTNWAA